MRNLCHDMIFNVWAAIQSLKCPVKSQKKIPLTRAQSAVVQQQSQEFFPHHV